MWQRICLLFHSQVPSYINIHFLCLDFAKSSNYHIYMGNCWEIFARFQLHTTHWLTDWLVEFVYTKNLCMRYFFYSKSKQVFNNKMSFCHTKSQQVFLRIEKTNVRLFNFQITKNILKSPCSGEKSVPILKMSQFSNILYYIYIQRIAILRTVELLQDHGRS